MKGSWNFPISKLLDTEIRKYECVTIDGDLFYELFHLTIYQDFFKEYYCILYFISSIIIFKIYTLILSYKRWNLINHPHRFYPFFEKENVCTNTKRLRKLIIIKR